MSEQPPASSTSMVDQLLKIAQQRGASDLHLVANHPPFIRVDGDIIPLPYQPLKAAPLEKALMGVLTSEQRAIWHESRQLCFTLYSASLGYFRFNLYSHMGRTEAAIRVCQIHLDSLDTLGVPKVMVEMMHKPQGLLLITGATGSGKTTTMNALLRRISQESRRKIITIEDPVEYVHPPGKGLLVQQEIGLDAPSFASAVRHALRQDPDILCIGEMRDLDTIRNALTAAETGHLVVGTIHTNGAAGTISRIIDVFPPEQQHQVRTTLGMSLLGVLSQRLLPRASGRGRLMAYELMVGTDGIRNLIREGKVHQITNQLQVGRSVGMREMDAMIKDLYLAGEITYETAAEAIHNPKILMQR